MKKKNCALWLMLNLVPLFLLAQNEQTTFKREFVYQFANRLTLDVVMNASGYYDENDYEFLNGPFKASGKTTYSAGGINVTYTYSSNGAYLENKLQGNLNIKIVQIFSGSKNGTLTQELKASYQNGIPTGKWTWTKIAKINGKPETETTSVVFKDAKLHSITRNNGNFYIINQDGSISCQWQGRSFKNGIDTKYYYRKTGAEVEMDSEVLSLINQYAEGKLTKGDLVEKGYGLKSLGYRFSLFKDIIVWVNDQLTVGDSETSSFIYEIGSSINYYDDTFALWRYIDPNINFYPFALIRVSISPEETVMNALKEWGETNNIDNLLAMKEMINNNHFRNEFYFLDDVKEKALEYVNTQLMKIERLNLRRDELRQCIDSTLEYIYATYPNQEEYSSITRKMMSMYNEWVNDTLELEKYYENALLISDVCSNSYILSNAIDSTLKLLQTNNQSLYKEYDALTDTYYSANNCSTREDLESYNLQLQLWKKDLENCHVIYEINNRINDNTKTINDFVETYASTSVDNYNKYIQPLLKTIQKNMLMNSELMLSIVKQQENCIQYINELSKNEEKSNDILSCEYNDILKAYQGYLKSLNLAWTADASIQQLYDIQQIQDSCIKFISERKNIDNNTTTITNSCANYKDILKAYQGYLKSLNLAWTADASIQQLYDIQQIQDSCIKFISERKNIDNNTTTITNSCANYKDILKAYQGYLKSLNLAWTADTSSQILYDVQNLQKIFIKAINNKNANEINDKIKKNKDKSIEAITRILEE